MSYPPPSHPHCMESQGCHFVPSFICSLVILPIPVAPSVFSFWHNLLLTFQKCLKPVLFLLQIGLFAWPLCLVFRCFFYSGNEMIRWSVISVVCYLMALVLANFALRCVSFFIFLMIFVDGVFKHVFFVN